MGALLQIAYILAVFGSGIVLGTLHGDKARRRITQLLLDLQDELLKAQIDLAAARRAKPRKKAAKPRSERQKPAPRKATKPAVKSAAKARKVKP